MPDGSDSPEFLERLQATAKIISPPSPPAHKGEPLSREQAHGYHRQGRVVACGVATVAELSGAVALGLLGNIWVGLALGGAYIFLSNRNSDIQHPSKGDIPYPQNHTMFDDMARNYGSTLQDSHSAENFKPYNPKRGKWSYRLGGTWCGLTSRTLGACIVRELAKECGKVLGWRPPKRRDVFKPDRPFSRPNNDK